MKTIPLQVVFYSILLFYLFNYINVPDDGVYYTLQWDVSYDPYISNNPKLNGCKVDGHKGGLAITYLDPNGGDMPPIPAGKKVEVPIGFQSLGSCFTFNNVKLMIIATCEAPSASSRVVQYSTIPLTVPVQINYNMSAQLYASNDTAFVSMAWQSGRRRLSDESEHAHSLDKEEIISQIKDELREQMMGMTNEMKLSRKEIAVGGGDAATASVVANHDGELRTLKDEIKLQKDDLTGQIDTLKDQIGALQGQIDTQMTSLKSELLQVLKGVMAEKKK